MSQMLTPRDRTARRTSDLRGLTSDGRTVSLLCESATSSPATASSRHHHREDMHIVESDDEGSYCHGHTSGEDDRLDVDTSSYARYPYDGHLPHLPPPPSCFSVTTSASRDASSEAQRLEASALVARHFGVKGIASVRMAAEENAAKRKYRCRYPDCAKSFTTSGHLARHNRIHTKEKNYVCLLPGCYSRFSRKDNMMQHFRTHDASNPKRSSAASTRRAKKPRPPPLEGIERAPVTRLTRNQPIVQTAVVASPSLPDVTKDHDGSSGTYPPTPDRAGSPYRFPRSPNHVSSSTSSSSSIPYTLPFLPPGPSAYPSPAMSSSSSAPSPTFLSTAPTSLARHDTAADLTSFGDDASARMMTFASSRAPSDGAERTSSSSSSSSSSGRNSLIDLAHIVAAFG